MAERKTKRRNIPDRPSTLPHIRHDNRHERTNILRRKNDHAPSLRRPRNPASHPEKQGNIVLRRPNHVGELVAHGPQVMKGYWNKEEESKMVLRNGWLYTGDIGKMDEDGYFYITDRKKDLIKYKGYSVYPREIEDVIYEHPAVKLCAVVGKPDPVAGEIPKAFIVLKEGKTATPDEIKEFVNSKLAPYKAVREVEFRTELPMTLVGKVLRRVLLDEEKQKATKT